MYRLLALIPVVAIGCKSDHEPAPAASQTPTPAPAHPACAKAKPEGPIAWIADDYDAALACAKSRKLPVVLDLWAPWCHTCLSMQSTVFLDPSFAADADQFVFASLDTDRDANAAAVAKFPPSAWPTFYVVSADEQVLARFVGGASLAQFHTLLDTGRRVLAGGVDGADARLLAAERLLAGKHLADAERELTAAIAAAPADWKRKPDALANLIMTRMKLKDIAGCLQLAETEDPPGNAASVSDFLVSAMGCAEERAKDEAPRVTKLRERAVARWQKLLDDPAAPLSVDDRSDAMASLRETLVALGKPDDAKAIAEKQRALLDETAAKAPTPMAAMTYNWPRAEVYAYLGRPLDLVPALEKSAKDLPTEYDPRSRLGWIYLKAEKYPEAAKWTDEALALAYGPRKTRMLAQRAEIAARLGDKAGERKFREEVVKTLEALPPTQTTPDAIAKAKQAVADLDKPATAKN